jgi:hypothetical protein
MIGLIIFIWWLSGYIPLIIYWKLEFNEVTVGDLIKHVLFAFMGPIGIIILSSKFIGFWDKKIF